MREVYVNDWFCAVIEDGHLVEYLRRNVEDQSGEILLGRVERMMPGMMSCFVDIGRKRSGFLPTREGSGSFTGGTLKSGERIIIQIRKEETGGKGAFLTRDVSMCGRYVMLMPMNRHIGISSRITDTETRERLHRTGREIARETAAGIDESEERTGAFGLVMRTAAAEATETEIREDVCRLWEAWQEILRKAEGESLQAGNDSRKSAKHGTAAGRILWNGAEDVESILNDYAGKGGVDRVVYDAELTADLERQLRSAGLRKIALPHGGNIVIDRCEAMTVIDVNTGGDTGGARYARSENGRGPEGIFLETNLEACGEIARQVRLRNLSGMLIIDFINLQSEEDQRQVLETLGMQFERDRVKTVIHGLTTLGLVEMTRKRSRPDWYEQETVCCPACGGSGRIKKGENE